MNEKVSRIEAIVGRRVKRDITRMTQLMKGNLQKAAESILNAPDAHVGIVTGFFIQHATPPSPETDGLIGMGHLAAGLASAGLPVTVITDAPCAKAVWAVVNAVPEQIDLEVAATNERSVYRLRKSLESADRPITHLIAIERVSPAADGKPHREHGWDMSGETAPLHLLFDDLTWQRRWITIGIGDGGNEIGMGSLPADIVETEIPNGRVIAATTPADYLIVAGVSNWGAMGFSRPWPACNRRRPPRCCVILIAIWIIACCRQPSRLGRLVDDSRVDSPGRPQMSVDRLPWEQHAILLEEIAAVVT